MKECNVILQAGITAEYKPKVSPFKVLERFEMYNYFCLKFGCFQSFFGREKGVIKCCPNCYQNDGVVGRFEKQ